MTSSSRPQSKAVTAGTAAGLRHLERAYVAKVNAAIADDRTELAHELAAEHVEHAAAVVAADHASADRASADQASAEPGSRRSWFPRAS